LGLVVPVSCYKFGEFELDSARFELRRDGRALKLERIPMELLILLAEKDGNVVSRQEIVERLWGKDVFVDTEHGVNTAVRKIRQALRDDPDRPRFLETVTGKGYRFVALRKNGSEGPQDAQPELEAAPTAVASPVTVPPQAAPGKFRYSRLGGSAAVALCLLVGVVLGFNVGGIRDRFLARNHPPQIQSIAVLPLANLSGDPTQDYFADGMTDELITALAKYHTLRVVSRTSAMQYRGARRPLREIARELGVDGVLEGSVKRSGNRVHMTVQLIYAPSDTHVWAESYDRDLNEIFSLPLELAQTIAKEVNTAVSPARPPRYINPEAHDAFLRGRYEWFSYHNVESAKYFRRAIEIQPDYAAAWDGLAGAYGGAAVVGELKPQEAWPQAEAATARALELDDRLPDAHNTNAGNFLFYRWDFVRAEQESARTIELGPNLADAYHLRSYALHALNRTDEALQAQRRATELDPFARPWALGVELWRLRRFDDAEKEARRWLAARPNDVSAHLLLSNVYRLQGKSKESVQELEQSLTSGGDQAGATTVRQAYERGGFKAVQELDLADLKKKALKQYVPPISFAYVYARLGMKEETIHYLQLAYEEHSPRLIHLQYEPDLDFLHSDERYRDIVRKVGLPPAF
jgi:TolB-like protein/DNA-binding winged helix-turn-helix (wHTH) protein